MRLTAALAIGSGSTLGVYASSAMPDVFLGFGVLAAGLFLLWSERLPVRARWMVLLVVAIAAAAHPTHGPVLIGAVLVLAFASWLFPALLPSAAKRALVSVLLAALAGAAAIVIAREVGSRVLGEPLRYPLFSWHVLSRMDLAASFWTGPVLPNRLRSVPFATAPSTMPKLSSGIPTRRGACSASPMPTPGCV